MSADNQEKDSGSRLLDVKLSSLEKAVDEKCSTFEKKYKRLSEDLKKCFFLLDGLTKNYNKKSSIQLWVSVLGVFSSFLLAWSAYLNLKISSFQAFMIANQVFWQDRADKNDQRDKILNYLYSYKVDLSNENELADSMPFYNQGVREGAFKRLVEIESIQTEAPNVEDITGISVFDDTRKLFYKAEVKGNDNMEKGESYKISVVSLRKAFLNDFVWPDVSKVILVADNADISYSKIIDRKFVGASFVGAKFYKSDLTDSYFLDTNLSWANFREAIVANVLIKNSSLDHADFTNADLTGAKLWNVTLVNAVFSEADLTGVIIKDVDLSGVDLRGAKIDCSVIKRAINWKDAILDEGCN
ncbi:pentapeptide repeat-containing protein [Hahella aquimaris]|uniref:pentapeptide repeat-containing protein n=1 Tax=Hahella sp. HNIBRBA332 TaxID=3015983 RepID=UPI00273C3BB6|nr:pentapeptide repeat-containing protein [Hahella sp. HNIBRBA332]WLQ15622.1 pentapeptide repeat-containing protein [Hahella sp. HNIBRBA332]